MSGDIEATPARTVVHILPRAKRNDITPPQEDRRLVSVTIEMLRKLLNLKQSDAAKELVRILPRSVCGAPPYLLTAMTGDLSDGPQVCVQEPRRGQVALPQNSVSPSQS